MWNQPRIFSQYLCTKKIKIIFNNNVVRTNTTSSQNNETLPSKAEVVVCGGGVMGAAVAYHLAVAGWGNKTILIESSRYISTMFENN